VYGTRLTAGLRCLAMDLKNAWIWRFLGEIQKRNLFNAV
jgi:hypothetical protein